MALKTDVEAVAGEVGAMKVVFGGRLETVETQMREAFGRIAKLEDFMKASHGLMGPPAHGEVRREIAQMQALKKEAEAEPARKQTMVMGGLLTR